MYDYLPNNRITRLCIVVGFVVAWPWIGRLFGSRRGTFTKENDTIFENYFFSKTLLIDRIDFVFGTRWRHSWIYELGVGACARTRCFVLESKRRGRSGEHGSLHDSIFVCDRRSPLAKHVNWAVFRMICTAWPPSPFTLMCWVVWTKWVCDASLLSRV